MARPFDITPVRTAADVEIAAQLFSEYASSIGIDLAYQGFATELATLPGKYAPPSGELLLARDLDQVPLGCIALRAFAEPGCCEMKRLYVPPRARGLGIGRALVEAIIEAAMRIGYREMRLDTLPTMTDAIGLYTRLGFVPIEAYYDTPIAGTVFLARSLGA
jgi:ribosomal protein S18 acetylase RimI-like enzyme